MSTLSSPQAQSSDSAAAAAADRGGSASMSGSRRSLPAPAASTSRAGSSSPKYGARGGPAAAAAKGRVAPKAKSSSSADALAASTAPPAKPLPMTLTIVGLMEDTARVTSLDPEATSLSAGDMIRLEQEWRMLCACVSEEREKAKASEAAAAAAAAMEDASRSHDDDSDAGSMRGSRSKSISVAATNQRRKSMAKGGLPPHNKKPGGKQSANNRKAPTPPQQHDAGATDRPFAADGDDDDDDDGLMVAPLDDETPGRPMSNASVRRASTASPKSPRDPHDKPPDDFQGHESMTGRRPSSLGPDEEVRTPPAVKTGRDGNDDDHDDDGNGGAPTTAPVSPVSASGLQPTSNASGDLPPRPPSGSGPANPPPPQGRARRGSVGFVRPEPSPPRQSPAMGQTTNGRRNSTGRIDPHQRLVQQSQNFSRENPILVSDLIDKQFLGATLSRDTFTPIVLGQLQTAAPSASLPAVGTAIVPGGANGGSLKNDVIFFSDLLRLLLPKVPRWDLDRWFATHIPEEELLLLKGSLGAGQGTRFYSGGARSGYRPFEAMVGLQGRLSLGCLSEHNYAIGNISFTYDMFGSTAARCGASDMREFRAPFFECIRTMFPCVPEALVRCYEAVSPTPKLFAPLRSLFIDENPGVFELSTDVVNAARESEDKKRQQMAAAAKSAGASGSRNKSGRDRNSKTQHPANRDDGGALHAIAEKLAGTEPGEPIPTCPVDKQHLTLSDYKALCFVNRKYLDVAPQLPLTYPLFVAIDQAGATPQTGPSSSASHAAQQQGQHGSAAGKIAMLATARFIFPNIVPRVLRAYLNGMDVAENGPVVLAEPAKGGGGGGGDASPRSVAMQHATSTPATNPNPAATPSAAPSLPPVPKPLAAYHAQNRLLKQDPNVALRPISDFRDGDHGSSPVDVPALDPALIPRSALDIEGGDASAMVPLTSAGSGALSGESTAKELALDPSALLAAAHEDGAAPPLPSGLLTSPSGQQQQQRAGGRRASAVGLAGVTTPRNGGRKPPMTPGQGPRQPSGGGLSSPQATLQSPGGGGGGGGSEAPPTATPTAAPVLPVSRVPKVTRLDYGVYTWDDIGIANEDGDDFMRPRKPKKKRLLPLLNRKLQPLEQPLEEYQRKSVTPDDAKLGVRDRRTIATKARQQEVEAYLFRLRQQAEKRAAEREADRKHREELGSSSDDDDRGGGFNMSFSPNAAGGGGGRSGMSQSQAFADRLARLTAGSDPSRRDSNFGSGGGGLNTGLDTAVTRDAVGARGDRDRGGKRLGASSDDRNGRFDTGGVRDAGNKRGGRTIEGGPTRGASMGLERGGGGGFDTGFGGSGQRAASSPRKPAAKTARKPAAKGGASPFATHAPAKAHQFVDRDDVVEPPKPARKRKEQRNPIATYSQHVATAHRKPTAPAAGTSSSGGHATTPSAHATSPRRSGPSGAMSQSSRKALGPSSGGPSMNATPGATTPQSTSPHHAKSSRSAVVTPQAE